ncbi:MAG TPA: LysM peptidoglycan-binding domain-containing protein [Ramlibacter sp.]|jgi:YD repeat-containing protein|uniref:LysM peptidoglycan-binding domain-containing protein n=1 Tax=Ramlibacter sp. TaxID=1917967 RepID=UPI002D56DA62|nr:LysM peptidoglycan-binding domain-containing protein [Ramlibacter sp.]HZY20285.1 LysM peptidoglycan-binding domain-containing protein [Ramlibacter sp.]
MVAIVSGNSLGLDLTSRTVLAHLGPSADTWRGASGERLSVNVANGNLVVQDTDETVIGRGPDAVALRTYNSQGLLDDDNGDNWINGLVLQPLRLTGGLGMPGSSMSRTGRDGSVAHFAWNAVRDAYVTSDGEGAHDSIRLVGSGERLEWQDGSTGAVEQYDAHGAFLLRCSRDPGGSALSYAYDASQRLASVATAGGDTVFYLYEGSNLAEIRTVASDGSGTTRVRYAYDAANRLVLVTVDLSPQDDSIEDGRVYRTQYAYDGTSRRLSSVTQSDGTSHTFTYVQVGDSHRVASVRDGAGHTTTFTYQLAAGAPGRTTVTDALGQVTRYESDAAGRLVQILAPAVRGVSASTRFAYDSDGNVVSVTDGEGRTTTFGYDDRGNQVASRDGAGNTIARSFDDRNQLLTETRFVVPDPDVSGPANPAEPLTARWVYGGGAGHLLRFSISAAGCVTEFRYNALGEQVTSITHALARFPVETLGFSAAPTEAELVAWCATLDPAATQRTDFSYDGRGQLHLVRRYARVLPDGSGVADGTESTERFVYSASGWLLQTIDAAGSGTSTTYDGLGRPMSTIDALGQVTTIWYDDAGGRTVVALPGGLVKTSCRDAAGRLVADIDSSPSAEVLGETRYFHDAADRLVMTLGPTGVRHWRVYDAGGTLAAEIDGNGSVTEHGHDRSGLATFTTTYANAVDPATLVDGDGQPRSDLTIDGIRPLRSPADFTLWRSYDGAGRLQRTAQTVGLAQDVAVTEWRYDGASRVVAQIQYANLLHVAGGADMMTIDRPAPSTLDRVTRNFHDAQGRLLGTLDPEGFLTTYQYTPAGHRWLRVAHAQATDPSLRATASLAELMPPVGDADQRTVWLHDGKGQVIAEVDAEGFLTERVFDAAGRVARSVRYAIPAIGVPGPGSHVADLRPGSSAADRVTLRSWDALGRLAEETDAAGTVTRYRFDAAGRVTSTVSAAGTSEQRTVVAAYDLQGRLVGELSAQGSALLTGGQTAEEVDAVWAGHGIRHTYDAAGLRTSSTDPSGSRTLFFYDEDGALTHTINAPGEVQETRRDSFGRVVEQVVYGARISMTGLSGGLAGPALRAALAAVADAAVDARTGTSYTRDSRIAQTRDALGFTTGFAYDAFGQEILRQSDLGGGLSLGRTRAYDRRGLLVVETHAGAGVAAVTSTIHDAFGRTVRTIDANGHVHQQAWDRLGRMVVTEDPTGGKRTTSYDAFDQVLSQRDASGHVTTYAYDTAARTLTVTTPEGIVTTTESGRHGQVLRITDGAGRSTSFTYDPDGRLLQTTTPLTTETRILDGAGRVLETTDANGNRVRYSYDAAQRVVSRTVDPGGLDLVTRYGYDTSGRQVLVVDPTGVHTAIEYDRKGQLLRQTVDPGGLRLQTAYAYDGQGRMLTVTTPEGTVTRSTYDALGRRVMEQVDPSGLNLTRRWSYDQAGNVTGSIDANGQRTRFAYDAANRLVFEVDPLGHVRQTTYDTAGHVSRVARYATPVALDGLAEAPDVASLEARLISQPAQDEVEHRVYDADGRLTWTIDGTGGAVRMVRDATGNVVEQRAYARRVALTGWEPGTPPPVAPDAMHDARTSTVYDALGRAIYTVDGVGAVVSRRYDGNGNLLSQTSYARAVDPGVGRTADAIEEALREVAAPSRDASVRSLFDAANRPVWSVDGTGAVTQFVYDRAGNVVRTVKYANAIAAQAAPASVAPSSLDRVHSMAYDTANRLAFEVDAVGAATEWTHDAGGNVVRRIAFAEAIAPSRIAALAGDAAAVRAALVPDASRDRVVRFAYDAAGRQVFAVDAEGAVTQTRHDGVGHPTEVTSHANLLAAVAPSVVLSVSQLAAMLVPDAAADRVTRQAYDAAGRLVFEVDPLGAVEGRGYDGAGRLQRVTRFHHVIGTATGASASAIARAVQPSAQDRVETFSYNAAGQRLAARDALNGTSSWSYDAIGRTLSHANALGAVWTYEHDQAGRVLAEVSPQVAVTSVVGAGPGGVVLGPTEQAAVVTLFSYDALGQLVARTEASGRLEQRTTRYEFDALGRQVRVVHPPVGVYAAAADTPAANGAAGAAQRVESLRALDSFTVYDTLGNAVANRDVGGAVSQHVHDRAGRVLFEIDAIGQVTGYVRNAFGEVVRLVRYAGRTALAPLLLDTGARTVSREQVEAALAAAPTERLQDRAIVTTYDRAGRATEVVEPTAYVVETSATGGRQTGQAGRTTRTQYDAFGQAVQVRSLRNAATGNWSVTTRYYDRAGRETATVDALGYLTLRTFNADGQLIEVIECATAMAQGGWGLGGFTVPTGDAARDRIVQSSYDLLGRKIADVRLNVEFSNASDGTSTRGQLVTSYGYDALGNQTSVTAADGATTFTRYDKLGRVDSIAGPLRPGPAPGTQIAPLVSFRRDAYGNVVARTEHASGALDPAASSHMPAASSPADRLTLTAYDTFGRAMQTVDANGSGEFLSYDAQGHAAKRWQGVTGNDGVTRTRFEVNVYDLLGQLVQTRTPAPTTSLRHGLTYGYTPGYSDESRSEDGFLQLDWSGLIEPGGGAVRVQVDYMDWVGAPPLVREFGAASAAAGVRLASGPGRDWISAFHISQWDGSAWVVRWSGSPAQATGSSIADAGQAEAGWVSEDREYNAFGEMTRHGVQGGRQEYFDYDGGGRLWRTNAGDGIDRIQLYDVQGHVAAEIRSAGSARGDANLRGFLSAQAADANPSLQRVDFTYDALGRITRQQLPERLEMQGGISVQRSFVSATVVQSAAPSYYEGGTVQVPPAVAMNRVHLGWNSLAGLGSGDVKVSIEYLTAVIADQVTDESGTPRGTTYHGGVLRTRTMAAVAGDAAASGVDFEWPEPWEGMDWGVSAVTRVVVSKKDAYGNWVVVIDQMPGYGRNAIEVAMPPDPAASVRLEMRAAGTAGDAGWWTAGLVAFGNSGRFDAGGLAPGSYQYRVSVLAPGQSVRTIGAGTMDLTAAPLNTIPAAIQYGPDGAGMLAWQAPGAAMQQALRFRPAGSTGAWSSLPIAPGTDGLRSRADTSGLPPGAYQFELLWTAVDAGIPVAHATGTFTVLAAVPSAWVPPANLPHIGGVSTGTLMAGAIFVADESGNGSWQGGSPVPALVWRAADATLARYRVPGGAWHALAIDNRDQAADESGAPAGFQKVSLASLPPGTYEFQVLSGAPAQATAVVTIHAAPSGFWNTVTEQVRVVQPVVIGYAPIYETRYATQWISYSAWVPEPPYIVGYDEGGYPVYAYPGHWELRWYPQTYAYQVEVGQQPVYATDESGNIVYQVVYVAQQRQVWVQPATPAPTVTVTTPPYVPGYWTAPVPVRYAVATDPSPGSLALSTSDGGVLTQSASLSIGDRWLRPVVDQKVDRWGNIVEVTDPRSAEWKTRYEYNASNQRIREIRPDAAGATGAGSPTTDTFYDKLGRQVAVKDANGHVNGSVFDAGGNLVEERHADGGVVRHGYDAFGERVRTEDAAGKLTRFTYDRMGRLLASERAAVAVYRANGSNQTEWVATRTLVDAWTYDQLGRKLSQTNGNGETVRYAYDLRGNVIESRQPLGQTVRAAFDAQGRKVAEVDANGMASTWSYDFFGRLTTHTDLGGTRYSYAYDNAWQLVSQTSTAGQALTFGYDAAGQQTSITDWATGKVSTYLYDLGGRRIRERVVQGGIAYQDNHLAYDAAGNLRDVADGRVHLTMEYDKVGNRKRVMSTVNYQGVAGEATASSDRHFLYDAMDRQVVVDAVDAAGNIGRQGHLITYDTSGNRTSDVHWTDRVATETSDPAIIGFNAFGVALYRTTSRFVRSEGLSTETYQYDALDRLQSVIRDGVQIDMRLYDGAGRVVQSGSPGNLPTPYADIINAGLPPGEMNGNETRTQRYDGNGRLLHQKVLGSDGVAKVDISWDPDDRIPYAIGWVGGGAGYDAAGNVLGYLVHKQEGQRSINRYSTQLRRGEGYQVGTTSMTSTAFNPASTAEHYDANGMLVGVTDSIQPGNNRTFVNDAGGRALWVNQGGRVQRQLVVGGEVMGVYGVGVDRSSPASGALANPNFADLVDFDFGYAPVTAAYPAAAPGAYTVQAGDTLQAIARSAYGDSKLWFRIADANGLRTSSDIRAGQTLNIPNRVGTSSNDATTFKPYDPARILGDMAPAMAMPSHGDDCGGVGKLLMVVVAVAVTVYTGAPGGAVNSFWASALNAPVSAGSVAVATAATAAAAGSIAGQVAGLATGSINSFDWRGVGLSALSGGITQGLPPLQFAGSPVAGVALRAGVANAMTQGIGVVTGLQRRFDWRGVAATVVGSAVGEFLGQQTGLSAGATPPSGMTPAQYLLTSAAKAFAAGLVTAAARGGRVAVQQVAVDAFGNALGQAMEGSNNGTPHLPFDDRGESLAVEPATLLPDPTINEQATAEAHRAKIYPPVELDDSIASESDTTPSGEWQSNSQTEPGFLKVWGSRQSIGRIWEIHQVAGARIVRQELSKLSFEEQIRSGFYGREDLLIDAVNQAHLSIDAPVYQTPEWSFMHAMSGPQDAASDARRGLPLGTTSSEKANAYVRFKFDRALEAAAQGLYDAAFTHLGYAIHTLQDSTSPQHHGFQLWDPIQPRPTPNWGWAQPLADFGSSVINMPGALANFLEGAAHGAQEVFNVSDRSNFARATRDAILWFVARKVPEGDLFARYGADFKKSATPLPFAPLIGLSR